MATKIWLKSPDPNGECCGCEGKTSPCDSCSCSFPIPFAPVEGMTNFTSLLMAQQVLAHFVSTEEPCVAYWPSVRQSTPIQNLLVSNVAGLENASWEAIFPEAGVASFDCLFKSDISDVHITLGLASPSTSIAGSSIKGFFFVYDEDDALVFSYISPTYPEAPGVTTEVTLPEAGIYTFYFEIQIGVVDISAPIRMNAFVQLADNTLEITPCIIEAKYASSGSETLTLQCEAT